MTVCGRVCAIINCHLAAHDNATAKRNEDWHRIYTTMEFGRSMGTVGTAATNAAKAAGAGFQSAVQGFVKAAGRGVGGAAGAAGFVPISSTQGTDVSGSDWPNAAAGNNSISSIGSTESYAEVRPSAPSFSRLLGRQSRVQEYAIEAEQGNSEATPLLKTPDHSSGRLDSAHASYVPNETRNDQVFSKGDIYVPSLPSSESAQIPHLPCYHQPTVLTIPDSFSQTSHSSHLEERTPHGVIAAACCCCVCICLPLLLLGAFSIGRPAAALVAASAVAAVTGAALLVSPATPTSPRPDLSQSDLLIWMGDLNYRLDGVSYEEACSAIARRQYPLLLECDQLRAEMKAGRAFVGMQESAVDFAPTYKFDRGTFKPLAYDSGEKRRVPAWCDRILFRDSFTSNSASQSGETSRIDSSGPLRDGGGGSSGGGSSGVAKGRTSLSHPVSVDVLRYVLSQFFSQGDFVDSTQE
ncbi:unnamed protein product [Closterium sp. Yama58-4]|nr:unnamed protein product [Closterium sp. Yama58-4]